MFEGLKELQCLLPQTRRQRMLLWVFCGFALYGAWGLSQTSTVMVYVKQSGQLGSIHTIEVKKTNQLQTLEILTDSSESIQQLVLEMDLQPYDMLELHSIRFMNEQQEVQKKIRLGGFDFLKWRFFNIKRDGFLLTPDVLHALQSPEHFQTELQVLQKKFGLMPLQDANFTESHQQALHSLKNQLWKDRTEFEVALKQTQVKFNMKFNRTQMRWLRVLSKVPLFRDAESRMNGVILSPEFQQHSTQQIQLSFRLHFPYVEFY